MKGLGIMRTPGVDKKLQELIKKHFHKDAHTFIAYSLGITEKSVWYMLSDDSPRDITFNFIGLLAVKFPAQWRDISNEYHHMG